MAKSLIGAAEPTVTDTVIVPEDGNAVYDGSPPQGHRPPEIDKGSSQMVDDLSSDADKAAAAAKAKADADAAAATEAAAAKAKADADAKVKADADAAVKAKADEEAAAKKATISAKLIETLGEGGFTKEKWEALTDDQKKEFTDALTDDQKKEVGIEVKKVEEKKGAPDKYADFKLPENVVVLPEVMEKAQATFKRMGLSQDDAQELINLNLENLQTMVQQGEQSAYSKFEDTRAKWRETVQNDPKIGGENLNASMAHVAQARKFFAGQGEKELIQALEDTGAGDNPAVFKFFVAVGKAIQNEKLILSDTIGENGVQETEPSKIMYG